MYKSAGEREGERERKIQGAISNNFRPLHVFYTKREKCSFSFHKIIGFADALRF